MNRGKQKSTERPNPRRKWIIGGILLGVLITPVVIWSIIPVPFFLSAYVEPNYADDRVAAVFNPYPNAEFMTMFYMPRSSTNPVSCSWTACTVHQYRSDDPIEVVRQHNFFRDCDWSSSNAPLKSLGSSGIELEEMANFQSCVFGRVTHDDPENIGIPWAGTVVSPSQGYSGYESFTVQLSTMGEGTSIWFSFNGSRNYIHNLFR